MIEAQNLNHAQEPALRQTDCSTSLPLEPCPKEMYLLEYFGIKEFDENQRLTVDLGILTDLLYGFEQKMGRQLPLTVRVLLPCGNSSTSAE